MLWGSFLIVASINYYINKYEIVRNRVFVYDSIFFTGWGLYKDFFIWY
jgi:hypothetical protein